MRIQTHIEMLKTDIDFNNVKSGLWETVSFKPFWEVTR